MSDHKNPPLPPPLPDDASKLVGGWTAGTLSDAERKALHHAALDDQALFNQLADEEGVRELFADPATRAELAELLDPEPGASSYPELPGPGVARAPADAGRPAAPARQPVAAASAPPWWRWIFRPAPMAAFSAGAVAVLAFVVLRPSMVKERDQAVFDRASPSRPVAEEQDDLKPKANQAVSVSPAGEKAAPARAAAVPKELAKDKEQRADRAASAAAAAPPQLALEAVAVAPPAELPQSQPAGPPAPATVALSEAGPVRVPEDKRRAAVPAKLAAPPPVRYRIEREQAAGEWVEFGGELSRGERARIAVTANAGGVVTVQSGRESLAMSVMPGQTVYFPGSGSLPSDPGEREVAIHFQPGLPALAAPPAAQNAYQAAPLPPMPRAMGRVTTVTGGTRQKAAGKDAAPAQDRQEQQQLADAPEAAVVLTVRLRYR